jgi:hypothetical protein
VVELTRTGPVTYRIAPHAGMRVPGVVYASEALLPDDAG